MDDSFELLIYILFIVISLIGGVYKNYSKKKAEEQRKQKNAQGNVVLNEPVPEPQVSQPKRNPLEEFLRQQLENIEYNEMESEREPEPVPEPLDNIEQEEGTAVFQSTAEALLADELSEAPKDFYSENSSQNYSYSTTIEDNDLTKSNKFLADFDARKAIIYSEILKRPEY